MHVISLKGENTHFQRNSKHERSDDEPQISLRNSPAESVVAEVASLAKDNKFSFYDVVKAVRGNFIGFYATATDTSDTTRINEINEL